jgi:serine/threonine protein kinase
MIRRNQYDNGVDMWCIGILCYELATGKTPFNLEFSSDITKKIIKKEIVFQKNMSTDMIDFIKKLTYKDP